MNNREIKKRNIIIINKDKKNKKNIETIDPNIIGTRDKLLFKL